VAVIDPHVLQKQADEVLDAVGSDLMEGRAKDAIRLLQAIIDNPLVASLVVRILDWADKHVSQGKP
jgi:hypothetical protein